MENVQNNEDWRSFAMSRDVFIIEAKKIVIVIIGAIFGATALNLFLIPANVFASGFTGIAQLLSGLLSTYTSVHVSTGILFFLLNIPVTILGWVKVGKGFTIYSFISVFATTFFLEVIPVVELSPDILLNAVFGGVIGALGVGLTLKWGLPRVEWILSQWFYQE